MLEIDIQGAMQVKEKYPDAVLVYIVPPSKDVLAKRLRDRQTDSEKVIEGRLAKAYGELAWIEKYDYLVVNDDLQQAIAQTAHILEAETNAVNHNANTIQEILKSYE